MTETTHPESVRDQIQTRPVRTIVVLMASTVISVGVSLMTVPLWVSVIALIVSVKLLISGIKGTRQMFYSWGWI